MLYFVKPKFSQRCSDSWWSPSQKWGGKGGLPTKVGPGRISSLPRRKKDQRCSWSQSSKRKCCLPKRKKRWSPQNVGTIAVSPKRKKWWSPQNIGTIAVSPKGRPGRDLYPRPPTATVASVGLLCPDQQHHPLCFSSTFQRVGNYFLVFVKFTMKPKSFIW